MSRHPYTHHHLRLALDGFQKRGALKEWSETPPSRDYLINDARWSVTTRHGVRLRLTSDEIYVLCVGLTAGGLTPGSDRDPIEFSEKDERRPLPPVTDAEAVEDGYNQRVKKLREQDNG